MVTGAVIGAVTTPPPSAIRLTAVQHTAVVSSGPTPTPLLAALIGCPDATPGECPDNIVGTALGALLNFAAVGVTGAVLTWDDIVNLGADVVANLAPTPAALGVALSTGINLTVQNLLGPAA